jgi:ferredoxin
MKASKDEKLFVERVRRFPDHVVLPHADSVMEGFEYFGTDEFRARQEAAGGKPHHVLLSNGVSGFFKLVGAFGRNLKGVIGGKRQNFTDVEPYVRALEEQEEMPSTRHAVIEAFPNEPLWSELKDYAWQKHRAVVGFTELPAQYLFTDKAVLFRHSLVFIQEMRKEPIELAPEVDAGVEVITVYNTLGQATNDIACWLRDEHGVVCMANHPLGGLVDTTPLAENAGMGWIGHSGLLITPQFGPRCRISPIFVDQKIFEYTDSREHEWIQRYCATCHRCEKGCPQDAILPEKRISVRYGNGLRDRTETIDREQCFAYFRPTMGCALCIKNCPFSKNPAKYEARKTKIQ